MMRLRYPSLVAVAILGPPLTMTFLVNPARAAATDPVRYAGPTGSGTTCTAAAPCSVRTALEDAHDGDEVILRTGLYRSAADPFSKALTDEAGSLRIHGEANQPAPVIYSNAAAGISLSNASSLSDVVLIYSGSQLALESLGAPVDHVAIGSTEPDATACEVSATLVDSVCVSTGAHGVAYLASQSSDSATTSDLLLVNDTLVASGSGGVAVLNQAGAKTTLTLRLVNTIAKGDAQDLEADSQAATAHSVITTDHCDYLFVRTFMPTGEATISGVGQVQAAPRFVDLANGDFSEKRGSPTVNAGAHPQPRDTDLGGNPRVLGTAPDIGAYEHPQPPVAKSAKVIAAAKHTAQVIVRVNPRGLPTTLELTITNGVRQRNSRQVAVGSGRHVRRVAITVHRLARHTAYKVVAVATNAAGSASTKPALAHTK